MGGRKDWAKTKNFLSPALLEAAESAEKGKNIFGEGVYEGFNSAAPAGSAREKFLFFLSFLLDGWATP